jgi:hypothetical protein
MPKIEMQLIRLARAAAEAGGALEAIRLDETAFFSLVRAMPVPTPGAYGNKFTLVGPRGEEIEVFRTAYPEEQVDAALRAAGERAQALADRLLERRRVSLALHDRREGDGREMNNADIMGVLEGLGLVPHGGPER